MAQQELETIDNVMLSFALADNDNKLQRCVNSYLTLVLGLLKSSNQTTKSKVSPLKYLIMYMIIDRVGRTGVGSTSTH
jgi:hypothetical protein